MRILGQDFSKREQVLLAGVLSAAILAGAYWFWDGQEAEALSSPSEVRIRLEGAANKLQKDLRDLEGLMKNLDLDQVLLPATEESPSVHLHIEKTARDSGLGFSALTASNPDSKSSSFQTVTFRFTVTSELKALVKFVDTIQTGKYPIAVESWNMKALDDPKNVETDLSLKAYFQPQKGGKKS